MTQKTNKELIEEWLKHNKVEVIPEVKQEKFGITVAPSKIKIADIVSMGDAIDLYGRKQVRKVKKKVKKPNMSKINKSLIPESLHGIMNLYNGESKEDKDETNRN